MSKVLFDEGSIVRFTSDALESHKIFRGIAVELINPCPPDLVQNFLPNNVDGIGDAIFQPSEVIKLNGLREEAALFSMTEKVHGVSENGAEQDKRGEIFNHK